jgi:uncharacterized membrane protein
MDIKHFVEGVAGATELAGVVIIAGGLIVATARAALIMSRAGPARHQSYRRELGFAIVLGLEVLVAADIIRTVAFTPTLDSVIVLAMIVAIRTFLSWSLALELEGRWPWQRAVQRAEHGPESLSAQQ